MAAVLNTADLSDLERLLPMVSAFHAEEGVDTTEDHRKRALGPLLEGTPLGEALLIGPRMAPIGYVILSLGYSLEFGGVDAFIDEFYLRPGIRGKGMGGEILQTICEHLAQQNIAAVHLEVDESNTVAQAMYQKRGFKMRRNSHLMSRKLA